jgi:hypothetical protein
MTGIVQQRWDSNLDGQQQQNAIFVPPIQGNSQLMVTVWGGGEERVGQFGGMEQQIRVKVEAIWWRYWTFTKSPPNLSSAYPRVLGVRLRYQCHDPLVFRAQLEA